MAESNRWDVGIEGHPSAAPPALRDIRRSPRKSAAIPVWLRREEHGRAWEEETETLMLSRHGALVDCRRYVETGGRLSVVRRDTGRRATARVAYGQFGSSGRRELGIEFLACENFWDLDWDTVTEASAAAASAAAPASEPQEETLVSQLPWPPAGSEQQTSASAAALTESEPAASTVIPSAARNPSEAAAAPAPKRLSRAELRRARIEETLVAAERCLWEAHQAGDRVTLAELLGSELVSVSGRGVAPGATELELPAGEVTLDDFRVTPLGKTAAVVTCVALDAEARPAYHSSLWLLRNGRWQIIFHQQTPAA